MMKLTKKQTARGISTIFHPFMLPLYMVLLMLTATVFVHYPIAVKLYLLGVVALYAMVIPLLALALLRRVGYISDLRLDNRRERMLPLLIGAICYILCAITLAKLPSLIFLRKFMIAAACCEVMCLLVSLRWKISLHLTGMGAVVAMLVILNIATTPLIVPLIVALLATGLLASARLYLGCHNGYQILAGFTGGFLVTILAVLFL